MSDKLKPIPFRELLLQSIMEYRKFGSFFSVPVSAIEKSSEELIINGKRLESPIGPAAGPHTQLAQNIIAAYGAGARYIELKTVQILSGEELGIQKPCIYVKEEAYNTEWSSELPIQEALEEYIKAWIAVHLLRKEFNLGSEDGFIFNMSVGYDLKGIMSPAVDGYIESMKEAGETDIFKNCIREALEEKELFLNLVEEDIISVPSCISDIVTLSTMHGCPPGEIEAIAGYLMKEKGLNTHLKCNPTLLGYEKIRELLNVNGYSHVSLDREVFLHDISLYKAVELIKDLKNKGKEYGKEFGIKLTNTLPVKIENKELQGEAMYLSGPALYPITIGTAAVLREALGENIKMSYSGGADTKNIGAILMTGIRPVTVSTLLLKSGGYRNLTSLNKAAGPYLEALPKEINTESLKDLSKAAENDENYWNKERKEIKKPSSEYSAFCSKCRQCMEVCPNRANQKWEGDGKIYILHRDGLCNECGNCKYFCPLGHIPYLEKFTLFENEELYINSENTGLCRKGEEILLRWKGENLKLRADSSLFHKPVTEFSIREFDEIIARSEK